MKADFTQYTGSTFNQNAGVNFNVKMGDGADPASAYDQNGNIKRMQQWGLKIGSSSQIDDLSYLYQSSSNKLARVTDTYSDANTKLGDFKDGTNIGTDDYDYDGNGNMNLDHNKSISSITYNHLNLPSVITVTGKGTITYTYDAAGVKQKKTTVDNTVNPTKTTTTLYIGGAVFENDVLQFVAHEEGRIRLKTSNNTLHYDYFIKDHLGNVRMVLIEEQQTDAYPPASMETAQSTTEETFYSNLSVTREDKPSGYPTDTYTNPNEKVAKVRGDGNKIGPAMVLKVMAGDAFNLRVSSWYKLNGSTPNSPSPITTLAQALAGAVAGVSGGKVTEVELTSSGLPGSAATSFLNSQSFDGLRPKAFINWIFLDEQFKYYAGGFEQVGTDQEFKVHLYNGVAIIKSGYLYIYVSNETPNIDVFFDNLQVTHVRGPMVDETHYYAFGLPMVSISSSKLPNTQPNKLKYNGKEQQRQEFSDDSGLEWLDYGARMYDAQIGRFFTQDRFADKYHSLTSYHYGANNPISIIDINGDSIWIVIKSNITDASGNQSIKEDKYYYGQDKSGTYGFLDGSGTIYSGSEAFVGDVTTAIDKIRTGGDVGKGLVNDLMTSTNNTEIVKRSSNSADEAKGDYITWNPTGTTSAPDTKGSTIRPSFIGLAHEMAHVRDVWDKTIDRNTWQSVTDASGKTVNIKNAELYATHIENQIRSENKLPLRAYYSVDAGGSGDPNTRLIRAGTQQSLYYNAAGTTNYKQLERKQPAFTYQK